MSETNGTYFRLFAGRTVLATFAVLFGLWLLLATGWIPDELYGPLYVFWLPSYLAFAGASGLRNTVFSWLGSDLLFRTVVFLFTYIEAVIVAGLVRILRTLYRQKRGKQGASS